MQFDKIINEMIVKTERGIADWRHMKVNTSNPILVYEDPTKDEIANIFYRNETAGMRFIYTSKYKLYAISDDGMHNDILNAAKIKDKDIMVQGHLIHANSNSLTNVMRIDIGRYYDVPKMRKLRSLDMHQLDVELMLKTKKIIFACDFAMAPYGKKFLIDLYKVIPYTMDQTYFYISGFAGAWPFNDLPGEGMIEAAIAKYKPVVPLSLWKIPLGKDV